MVPGLIAFICGSHEGWQPHTGSKRWPCASFGSKSHSSNLIDIHLVLGFFLTKVAFLAHDPFAASFETSSGGPALSWLPPSTAP